MAYDPATGKVYGVEDLGWEIDETSGHYSLRANDYDGLDFGSAQRRASRAAIRLDLLSADERTSAAIMEVRELTYTVNSMAMEANVMLVKNQ